MIVLFIHIYDTKTYEEFVKRGAIPLKTDETPYICMEDENVKLNFADLNEDKFEFSEVMYL